MQGNLSLRERLLVVLAAALVPLFAAAAWMVVRQNEASIELAHSELRFAASLLAAHQDRAVDAAEQMLAAVATVPDLRTGGRARCEAYLDRLLQRYDMYANIGLIAPDGQVLCHALGPADASLADREYFRDALASRRFTMGEPIVGRFSGRRSLPFALPVIDNGELVAIAYATLDLDRAAGQLTSVELPPGARVMVADRRGRVLMEYPPQAGKPVERTVVDPVLLQAARTMTGVTGEAVDAANEPRVFAIAPTHRVGDTGFVVRVGLPRAALFQGAWTQGREALFGFALLVVSALASVWWIGGRLIVRPAKQILGTVRRLEKGRLDARVPLYGNTGRGEFARMAAAFNLMADSLQLRQADVQAELERSRGAYELLDQVLNSMQEALVAVSADGRFLLYNDAAARMFPMQDAPMLPALWPEHFGFFHEDRTTRYDPVDLPLVRAALGDAGGRQQLFARNARVPDGRLLQCSWQPLKGGTVRGGLVVFTDITELHRLQAEQAAQFAQLAETQRKLIESRRIGRVANWEMDLANGRLWWSDEMFTLFGVEPGAFEGTLSDFERCVHPDDRALLKPARDRALRDGEPLSLDYRIVKPDGSIAWIHEISETRRDESGEPVWFGAMVQDVTQRKLQAIENANLLEQVRELNAGLESRIAERTAQLARQEQLYRTLAEQAPEVVWHTDARGDVTYLNRAWYELVGGTPADWLGQGWFARVHPDDREEVRSNWLEARHSLKPLMGTRRMLARDGSYHVMSYKASPIIDLNGQALSWVGIDADITHFKAIENALRSSNQELEAFSYSVSHDLRAPLGAIGGFARALESRIGDSGVAMDDKASHYFSRIRAGVMRMEQLIESLLKLSRVGRAPLEWGEADLSAIAREALDNLQAQDTARRVSIHVEDGLVAQGDARLLRIAMENLLGNAWKFTARTEGAAIHVGRTEHAFFVRDNGVGFEMAYADKLFTAFQRLHTESEFPGTGIGLATVRRIIGRHQGRVWPQSQPGQGTIFYFSLPETAPPAWLLSRASESA